MFLAAVLQTAPPNDIWNDPNALTLISIGVAVVLGIGGIATGIWAAFYQDRKQRLRKEITYERVSAAPIVTVNPYGAHRIKVLLDDKPAERINVLVFKVRNTGALSVKDVDYFEPLVFDFDGQVVSGEVLETEPENLLKALPDSFLKLKGQQVQLLAFSLNPGNAITFSVLVEGEDNVKSVLGRIDGGEVIEFNPAKEEKKRQTGIRKFRNRGALVGIALVALGSLIARYAVGDAVLTTIGAICGFVGEILLLISFIIWAAKLDRVGDATRTLPVK
jgi:hypothetical protein